MAEERGGLNLVKDLKIKFFNAFIVPSIAKVVHNIDYNDPFFISTIDFHIDKPTALKPTTATLRADAEQMKDLRAFINSSQ